jgi:transposase
MLRRASLWCSVCIVHTESIRPDLVGRKARRSVSMSKLDGIPRKADGSRYFSDEFKREAIRLVDERGNAEEVARELGIHSTMIYRWKKRLATMAERETAFPGHGNPKDPELVRLQRELARVKEENEILKKAVGIFTARPS